MTTTTITSPLAIELKNKPEEESPSHSHLESLLSNALDKYRKNNATSLALFEEDLGYMPGANTRAVLAHDPFPVVIARGESARLWDVDGHEYIDFLGEFSAGIYGHNCQTIKDAVSEAMDKGWNFGGKNQYEGQLAKLVVDRFSNSMELVRFTNSGTEANLMALGAALNFTGKQNVSSRRSDVPKHGEECTLIFSFLDPGLPQRLPWKCFDVS
jgi:glutamate-1-semialdehyde 2,1-aminomutase